MVLGGVDDGSDPGHTLMGSIVVVAPELLPRSMGSWFVKADIAFAKLWLRVLVLVA